MAQEKKFVKEAIRGKDLEEFLEEEFDRAGYSHSEIQRTPLSTRITIYAHKPGIVIGMGGKNIENITDILKEKFGLENPQLDVQEVPNPDLDAHIVARYIANAIERGLNYKRVANLTLEKVMSAGAVGVAIRISGKLGGEMGRTEKFSKGYLKYAGEPALTMVDTAYAKAQVKLGTIGIQVRIMKETPKELEILQRLKAQADVRGEKKMENVKTEVEISGGVEEKTVE